MNQALRLLILLLMLMAGCAWFSPKQPVPQDTYQYVKTGKVIDPEKLKLGGRILVVPFRAGVGVTASDALDQVALHVIKGLADELKTAQSSFSIVTSEEEFQADFVIEGHVTNLESSSAMAKLLMRKCRLKLGLKGKMMDRSNGATLLVFSDTRESADKNETHAQLGYLMGQALAELILSKTK